MKEKIIAQAMSQIANAAKEFFKEALPFLKEEGETAWNGFRQDVKEDWQKFQEEFKAMSKTPENLVFREEEFLNVEKLLAVVKQYIVEGSNEVYAWKKAYQHHDVIYLTYGVSGQPFESFRNQFVNIKVEALAKDVLALFGDAEVIVLK